MKSRTQYFGLTMNQMRLFSRNAYASGSINDQDLGSNFNFPKHKEYFNDMYYEDESADGAFARKREGQPTDKDYLDPNEPFTQENPWVPGGVLNTYKKRLNLTA